MRQLPGGRGAARPGYPPGSVQLYGAHGQPLTIQPPPPPGDYQSSPGHPPYHYSGRGPSPGAHQGPVGPSYDNYDHSRHDEPPRERPGSDGHPPILPPLPRRSSQGDYPTTHWNRAEPTSPPILPPPRGYSPPPPPPSQSSASTYGYAESAPSTYYPPATAGQPRRSSPPYITDRPSSISPHPTVHPPMWPGPPRPESTGPSTTPAASHQTTFQMPNIDAPHYQRSAHDNEMLNQLKRGL